MVHSSLCCLSITSMPIIKPKIRSKIDSILAFRTMNETGDADTPEEGAEGIYTNTPPGGGSFEDRFSFRPESLLPPPVPSKATLERGTRTGTIPKLQKIPLSPLTPRTQSSPKTPARGYDGDSSFESGIESISKEKSVDSNDSSSKVQCIMKDSMLLHDTLKTISVQKTEKEAANVTINRFICITILLTNVMSCSISILGTILVYGHVMTHPTYQTNTRQIRLHDSQPEELHLDVHHLHVNDDQDERDIQEGRDKRDRSPLNWVPSQPSHLVQSTSPQTDRYPGDKDQLQGVTKQHPPQDRDLLLQLGKNLDNHFKIDISVSKPDNTTEEEDSFWVD